MNFRRLISFLLIFCLIFTQTAQAYSLVRLPHQYQRIAVADGSLNDTDTRRMNNKHENQTVTNQITSLTSAGDITTDPATGAKTVIFKR